MSEQQHHATSSIRALMHGLQLVTLLERFPERPLMALFALINGFVAVGLVSVAAVITHQPFVFPSAGATAFLLFFAPKAPWAAPRNVIIGHAAGAVSGVTFGMLLGTLGAGSVLPDGVTWVHGLAAASALGVTAAIMVLARAPHPPGGATSLTIALGIMMSIGDVVVLLLAILLLVGQAIAINRLAGLEYPLWGPIDERAWSDRSDDAGVEKGAA